MFRWYFDRTVGQRFLCQGEDLRREKWMSRRTKEIRELTLKVQYLLPSDVCPHRAVYQIFQVAHTPGTAEVLVPGCDARAITMLLYRRDTTGGSLTSLS